MHIDEIRKHMIAALFTDDDLMDRLVLKGGNAIALIHKVSQRATVDIDFSMEEKFPDDFNPKGRIEKVLNRHFKKLSYTVLDLKFSEKPQTRKEDTPGWWGGYLLNFKLIETEKTNLPIEDQRRNSVVLGPNNKRNYKIDISYCEYCKGKEKVEVHDIVTYVYSLEMIVIEKLRAICQQMSKYELISNPRGRARDFYDIYTVLTDNTINLSDRKHVFEAIFNAKNVPLEWMFDIEKERSFHKESWTGVEHSVSSDSQLDYNICFDYVCSLVEDLKSSWNM